MKPSYKDTTVKQIDNTIPHGSMSKKIYVLEFFTSVTKGFLNRKLTRKVSLSLSKDTTNKTDSDPL